jgi:hypothetical protein
MYLPPGSPDFVKSAEQEKNCAKQLRKSKSIHILYSEVKKIKIILSSSHCKYFNGIDN